MPSASQYRAESDSKPVPILLILTHAFAFVLAMSKRDEGLNAIVRYHHIPQISAQADSRTGRTLIRGHAV